MTPFTPTNLLLLFDFNPNSLSGKSIFSLGFHPQHQVRAASHLLLPPSGEAQGTSCLGVCSCPKAQHSRFKPNRQNLQIASGSIHKGPLTEDISSSRPWETGTRPFQALPCVTLHLPSGLHKQALPYPFFRNSKENTFHRSKGPYTSLSPVPEVTNAGPTCPPALSKGLSPPPLVLHATQREAQAKAASCAFSSCWVKLQGQEGHILSSFFINSSCLGIKGVSNLTHFRTLTQSFYC